ncbi:MULTISPECIES: hypothetical protein [unclassified Sphingomonas]|uniref:hypothetical protein n=1 Tax=unclassified Sphingomonas TaxID=196159 RepID=UPI000A7076DF|nr:MULTISPECIES: hypothetical protein [unclassified Sphingomonas]
MLNDVQRAQVASALKTLEENDGYSHPVATIIRIAGKQVAMQIAQLETDYRNANDAAKEHGGAMLSPEAADYWQEAQGVLRYARIALAGNDPKYRKEKALARKCERLEEGFAARVPDCDKPKFVQYDPQSLNTQDERWNWTVDGPFPLLSEHFNGSLPIANPKAEAQRVVLATLVDQDMVEDQRPKNVSRLEAMLRRALDERTVVEEKAQAVAAAKADKATKREKKEKLKKAKEALIASGDQKATKGKRSGQYGLVSDAFKGIGPPKR